jgi:hypothetical protein
MLELAEGLWVEAGEESVAFRAHKIVDGYKN